MVKVRFAPSPTGSLHIGGVRTALFNWLFAKHNNGKFILRIEDTDRQRSTQEAIDEIIEGLKWIGLNWDGEPYFQSKRIDIYKAYADMLLREEKAYYCYCLPEELEQRREFALKQGKPPKYDRRCLYLSRKQIQLFESSKRPKVIRFKSSDEGSTTFDDIIRGEVKFENALLDDFIIMKSDGLPTYNMACVVDDGLMGITHVIRGDDHISNTPRQILLYNELGFKIPAFAHLPMILGPDRTRLSKRHGATSLLEYREKGYLPEAILNYIALLGWATSDSQQIFEKNELIEKFSLERVGKSAAVFDFQKLRWLNGEYIRKMSVEELTKRALPWIEKANLNADFEKLKNAVALEQEKIVLLSDAPYLIEFLIRNDIVYEDEAVEKVLRKEKTREILLLLVELLKSIDDFSSQNLENIIRLFSKERSLKTAEVFHPLRVSVSGRTRGPSLFHMLEYLGKQRVLERIEKALTLI